MALEQKDVEVIERLVYKNADDIAISVARSFERLEERIDAAESRIYSRLSEIEDKVEASRQDISDEVGLVRDSVRGIARMHDQPGDVDELPEV